MLYPKLGEFEKVVLAHKKSRQNSYFSESSFRLLRAAIAENDTQPQMPSIPVIYADDVISLVAENSVGRHLVFDFFLDNWQIIYYR